MNELRNEVKKLFLEYDKLYKTVLTESVDIAEYGTNEFFGGKREAFLDILELFKKSKLLK